MSRHRTFDYEECRLLHGTGMFTRQELADRFGVSTYAIDYATKERLREYARAKQETYRVPCEDCGAPMYGRYNGSRYCKPCAARHAATSVCTDSLRCVNCREWKPDDDFPRNRSDAARRERHTVCRVCQTELKREWRRRNPTHARDYSRKRRAHA